MKILIRRPFPVEGTPKAGEPTTYTPGSTVDVSDVYGGRILRAMAGVRVSSALGQPLTPKRGSGKRAPKGGAAGG